MLNHGVENDLIGYEFTEKPQLCCRRFRLAERRARAKAASGKQPKKLRFGPSGLEIFDYACGVICSLDDRQHIARGSAFRIVINYDIHRSYSRLLAYRAPEHGRSCLAPVARAVYDLHDR